MAGTGVAEGFAVSAGATLATLMSVAAASPDVARAVAAAGTAGASGLKSEPRCALVSRPGLGAFTARARDGWAIGVHEQTPAILRDFASLVVGGRHRREELDRILRAAAGQVVIGDGVGETDPIATAFADAAVVFVLAHELGHVLLGHERADTEAAEELSRLGLPVTYADAREEIEADAVAGLLLAGLPPQSADAALAGARVFFELTDRVHAVLDTGAESYLTSTHPHPGVRLAAVQSAPGLEVGPLSQFAQDDIDGALGRVPLERDAEALATLSSLASQAPVETVRAFMAAPIDERGRRFDASDLSAHLDSAELRMAAVACAALAYVEVNPFRWASPEQALGFAAVLRLVPGSTQSPMGLVLKATIPELDEVVELESGAVHWLSDDPSGNDPSSGASRQ